MKYLTLWDRLMANIHEPANEQSCWLWSAGRFRNGYGKLNIRVDGKHTTLCAHRVAFELCCRPGQPLAYDETLDHLCLERACINPSHLEVVSRVRNSELRWARRKDYSR